MANLGQEMLTALRKVAEVLLEQGCPDRIRLDRDTRWVGSWTAKDFPSPLLRFLQCLGIDPKVCPPQRPDKNPFAERYHRNFKYECQLIECPADLVSTVDVNQRYVHFYNFERPNQAIIPVVTNHLESSSPRNPVYRLFHTL